MKKIIAMLLALVICLSVFACNDKSKTTDTQASNSPYANTLKESYNQNPDSAIYKPAWFMYSWLTNNINDFKNPASVELTGNAYYAKDEASGEIKYFLIETRADNSFGGKTVGYVKVTASSLVQTDWEPSLPPKFEGEQVWNVGTAFIADAFKEFIANNY